MRRTTYVLFTLGLIAAIALIAWFGGQAVIAPLAHAGWRLALIPLYFLLPLTCAALAWRSLFPTDKPPFKRLYSANWIGLSVNWLLPVAQIGGELVRVRLLARDGVASATAGATVIVDKTLQAVTLAAYGLSGILLLALAEGGRALALGALLTTLLFAVGIYLFYRLQRGGLFHALASGAGRFVRGQQIAGLLGGARALDSELERIYRHAGGIAASCAWRLAFRLVLAGEIWIGLALLGHPIGLVDALIVESLAQAVRGAAFAIPGALGAQEGGIVLLGAVIGVPPEASVSLALIKRLREGVVGVPGLIAWQIAEGRILRRRKADS